jgi:hypothetical protein
MPIGGSGFGPAGASASRKSVCHSAFSRSGVDGHCELSGIEGASGVASGVFSSSEYMLVVEREETSSSSKGYEGCWSKGAESAARFNSIPGGDKVFSDVADGGRAGSVGGEEGVGFWWFCRFLGWRRP